MRWQERESMWKSMSFVGGVSLHTQQQSNCWSTTASVLSNATCGVIQTKISKIAFGSAPRSEQNVIGSRRVDAHIFMRIRDACHTKYSCAECNAVPFVYFAVNQLRRRATSLLWTSRNRFPAGRTSCTITSNKPARSHYLAPVFFFGHRPNFFLTTEKIGSIRSWCPKI